MKKKYMFHINPGWRALMLLMLSLFFTPALFSAETTIEIPKRVISLGPIVTEEIYLIGAQDRLIANTTYCDVPEAARLKEKIGSVIQMNVEKIISLRPDLVIASTLSRQKQINILKSQGIRVVKFENPETFAEICDMTMDLGKLLGRQEVAVQVTDHAIKAVYAIRAKTEKRPKRRVFIQIGIKPLHTTTQNTFIDEYITMGGGINIARNEKSGVYSREKVLKENPDVILIATMGSSKKAGEYEKNRWMQFKSLTAAANGEIHVLDPDVVCSPTPRTFVRGLSIISKLIHPGMGESP
jgi:iron complex transport system substrate-binding protein